MPICGVPGALVNIVDREVTGDGRRVRATGKVVTAVNMGSYNYLGFAHNSGPIHESVEQTLDHYGVGLCSPAPELGTTDAIVRLEALTACFLGVESCVVFGMGFATNSTNIQSLVTKGCLVMSDELNHSSLALGCRLSTATIHVFRHNDMQDLERELRRQIVSGQPKSGRPWKKIVIIAEGIYSMEGSIVDLPELIRIKKKYKCYLYLDEGDSTILMQQLTLLALICYL